MYIIASFHSFFCCNLCQKVRITTCSWIAVASEITGDNIWGKYDEYRDKYTDDMFVHCQYIEIGFTVGHQEFFNARDAGYSEH